MPLNETITLKVVFMCLLFTPATRSQDLQVDIQRGWEITKIEHFFFFKVSTELINFRKHHHAHNKHFSFSGDALRKEQPTRWNGCGRNPKRIWSAWRTSWPLWELAGPSSPGSQTALLPTHAPTPGTCQSNRDNDECRILNLNSDLKTVLPYLLMPNFPEIRAQRSFFCDFNLCEF